MVPAPLFAAEHPRTMAITAQRRLDPKEKRRFGKEHLAQPIPDLTHIQTASYAEFLQEDAASESRKDTGMESVLVRCTRGLSGWLDPCN